MLAKCHVVWLSSNCHPVPPHTSLSTDDLEQPHQQRGCYHGNPTRPPKPTPTGKSRFQSRRCEQPLSDNILRNPYFWELCIMEFGFSSACQAWHSPNKTNHKGKTGKQTIQAHGISLIPRVRPTHWKTNRVCEGLYALRSPGVWQNPYSTAVSYLHPGLSPFPKCNRHHQDYMFPKGIASWNIPGQGGHGPTKKPFP